MDTLIIAAITVAAWLLSSPLVLWRTIEKRVFRFNGASIGSLQDFEQLCTELTVRGFTVEPVSIANAGGALLKGTLFKHPTSRWVINYHMGTNSTAYSSVDFIRAYSNVASVFILEPEGFGASSGSRTAKSFSDPAASHAELLRRGYSTGQIIACGNSLGSFCATQEARLFGAPVLILTAGFSSLLRVLRDQSKFLWLYPAWMFPKSLRMNNVENLQDIRCTLKDTRVLIMHGIHDPLIPFFHAQTLYSFTTISARLVRLNAEHRNVAGSDPETFKLALVSFMESLPEST